MPKRILLADDSITIQKVVELTFSDGDYEVTAVNNGARAIQKLGDMKPDIILSDIIMPEKNGYEVCEYVKSHPEYRNIPVVLLTGTFEPFDPDRAEKAGCDAVVTKPFESQSLIHKVEELIAAAQSASATPAPPPVAPETVAPPPPPPAPSASPWLEDEPPAPSPFTTSGGSIPVVPEAYTHGNDIFGATPAPEATTEMPFEPPSEPPFGGGETRAFPRMSFDDLQETANVPPPPEPSPWDEQDFGGETRAFGKMSFDDLQSMQQPLEPQHPSATPHLEYEPEPEPEAESPFGAPPPAEEFSSETRAFERISFDDLQRQMAMPAPEPEPEPEPEPQPEPQAAAPEPSPWDEPAETPFGGGATQAFPTVSFDDFPPPAAPEPEPQAEASPWDEQPAAYGGETRAFPKMSFEELAASAPQPEPEPLAASEPEPAPWEEPSEPAWEPEPVETTAPQENAFATAAYASLEAPQPEVQVETPDEVQLRDLPEVPMQTGPEVVLPEEPELEELPTVPAPEEPAWSPLPVAQAEAEPAEPVVPPPVLAPESPSLPIRSAELSDEQVDRIARRVVELMSDQVVRNIAWEVIPDLAEMVVKERIRQLESEA